MKIQAFIRNPGKAAGGGWLAVILVGSTLQLLATATNAAPPSSVTDNVIIQIRAGARDRDVQDDVALHGGRVIHRMDRLGMLVVKMPQGRARAAAAALARSPRFKLAEPEALHAPALLPNDPLVPNEWHLANLQLFTAWDLITGSPATPIAILDSGVDPTHPDLQPKLVPGWNFYNNSADTSDVYGHGTKVAGAAAAAGNNGIGVVGPAFANPIMPIRVTGTDGWASDSAIIQGLMWAADHGAKVANLSFGGIESSGSILSAAQYFRSKGGLVTASAGNYGNDNGSPDTPYVISVSATGSDDLKTSWSSFGSYVDVAAPGSGIQTTTVGGTYASVSGTSFSAPVTAGVIALILAANPALTPSQAETMLDQNADDLGTPGFDTWYGWGRVNAFKAVSAALATSGPPPDTMAPVAAITSPVTGTTVSGSTTLSATASDNIGVTEVRFYADGQMVGSDTTSPYSAVWDTATAGDGTHALVADAYDAAANRGSSASVTVTADNRPDTTAPTVQIVSPADGSSVGNKTTFWASASDPSGISRVEFIVDGLLTFTDTRAPYKYATNTRRWVPGLHVIAVRATGGNGNTAVASVTVLRPADAPKNNKAPKNKTMK